MWLTSSLRNQTSNSHDRSRSQRRPATHCFRPHLEALEDRCLPSTLTVTTAADSVPGSLRYEIAAAQSGDAIVFDKSLKGQTLTLGGTELFINKNLTIEGLGAKSLAIRGGNQSRVFEVAAGVKVTLSGLTIEDGDGMAENGGTNFPPYFDDGGGILNAGTLTLSNCTVSGNSAVEGGGIFNELGGTLTVAGSIVTHNLASGDGSAGAWGGAGIFNDGASTLTGSIVTQNSTPGKGGGIFNDSSGVLTILSSTVKSNHGLFDLYNLGMWSGDSSTIGSVGP
jgi:hypothetical protein